MPQVLKEEVDQRIRAAALEVFAGRGLASATMAEIARAAGVSTGNVYHYYASKDALFEAVVPRSFVASLLRMLRGRMRALEGVDDVRKLAPAARYNVLSAELVDFAIENRLRVVVLLSKAAGTPHEGFAETTARMLERLAVAHFKKIDPELRVTETLRHTLHVVYVNLLVATSDALARFTKGDDVRAAVDAYTRYHLAGLKALFA